MLPDFDVLGVSLKTFGIFFALNFVAWGAVAGRRLKELGLTDQQKQQLANYRDQHKDEMKSLHKDSSLTREQRRENREINNQDDPIERVEAIERADIARGLID